MFKKMRIKNQLFFVYSLLIILSISVVSMQYYERIRVSLEDNAYESLLQIANSVSSHVDMQLQKLDDITTKVIFSEAVKDSYFLHLAVPNGVSRPTNLHTFNDAIYAIVGPMELDWQVNQRMHDIVRSRQRCGIGHRSPSMS